MTTTQTDRTLGKWGPQGRLGALSISFDNLGEAADLQRGDVIDPALLGQHYTALEFLPKLLRLTETMRATYFMEASNTQLYPTQIRNWVDAGHEVGVHGWRHEHWARLNHDERQTSLRRSLDAFQELDVQPTGFRPPGGTSPAEALVEYKSAGLIYCSPLGEQGGSTVTAGLAVLPFVWRHVDAYLLDTRLSALRERFGDASTATSVDQWEAILREALTYAIRQRTHVTVIFHPYLLARNEAMTLALQNLILEAQSERDLWLASCGDVANWLLSTHRN